MDIQNIAAHLLGTAGAINVIFNFVRNDGNCGGLLTTLCQRAIRFGTKTGLIVGFYCMGVALFLEPIHWDGYRLDFRFDGWDGCEYYRYCT